MSNFFQFAIFAGGKERKGIFNVCRAAAVVAQLFLMMLAKLQALASEAELRVPAEPAVAPILVPVNRRLRMAEKLNFHLLELPRAKRKVPGRDFVAKTLP